MPWSNSCRTNVVLAGNWKTSTLVDLFFNSRLILWPRALSISNKTWAIIIGLMNSVPKAFTINAMDKIKYESELYEKFKNAFSIFILFYKKLLLFS